MTKCCFFGIVAILFVGPTSPPASADPVTLQVTSGVLRYPISNPAVLEIQFPNGSADISWSDEQDEWLPDFYECCYAPGDRINVSADESFPTPFYRAGGEFRLGSEVYSVTSLKLEVIALRDAIVPSFEQAGGGWLPLTGIPFTFQGQVSGISAARRRLVLDLIGHGDATVFLNVIRPPYPEAELSEVNYRFEQTVSPVPEPGTWVLVATGLGAVMRRMGKNRK